MTSFTISLLKNCVQFVFIRFCIVGIHVLFMLFVFYAYWSPPRLSSYRLTVTWRVTPMEQEQITNPTFSGIRVN